MFASPTRVTTSEGLPRSSNWRARKLFPGRNETWTSPYRSTLMWNPVDTRGNALPARHVSLSTLRAKADMEHAGEPNASKSESGPAEKATFSPPQAPSARRRHEISSKGPSAENSLVSRRVHRPHISNRPLPSRPLPHLVIADSRGHKRSEGRSVAEVLGIP
jgi:hypothetical protein